ncbi:alpha/beta fold hydrolase [Acaryochloris sp. 'Moss Beach']
MPTLLLCGEKDPYFGKELTNNMDELVPSLKLKYIPDGGHWLPFTAP